MEAPAVNQLFDELMPLAKGLATPDTLRHLRAAAEPFVGVAGEAVIECHLGGRNHVDFTARLWPHGAAQLLRSARAPHSTLRFLNRWLARRGALQRVPYVELEQDLVDGNPFQWIGPAIRPGFDRGGGVRTSAEEDYVTALAVLESLPDWPLEVTTLANLEELFNTLPAGVSVNMLSSLGARARAPEPGLRLILSGPGQTLAERFAHEVVLPERHRELERWGPMQASSHVGFDIELDRHGFRRYLAVYTAFRNPDRGDSVLRAFLDLALSDKLCSRAEHDQLATLVMSDAARHTTLTFKRIIRDNRPAQMKVYLERLVY